MYIKTNLINSDFANLTPQEKKIKLYKQQKQTLDDFLERNAISRQQYDKSLGDLKVKMGISE